MHYLEYIGKYAVVFTVQDVDFELCALFGIQSGVFPVFYLLRMLNHPM